MDKKEKALELACKEVYELSGDCPAVILDFPSYSNFYKCLNNCPLGIKPIDCWKMYFLERAENER